jgi:hypothetical protein
MLVKVHDGNILKAYRSLERKLLKESERGAAKVRAIPKRSDRKKYKTHRALARRLRYEAKARSRMRDDR